VKLEGRRGSDRELNRLGLYKDQSSSFTKGQNTLMCKKGELGAPSYRWALSKGTRGKGREKYDSAVWRNYIHTFSLRRKKRPGFS